MWPGTVYLLLNIDYVTETSKTIRLKNKLTEYKGLFNLHYFEQSGFTFRTQIERLRT